VRYTTRKTYNL